MAQFQRQQIQERLYRKRFLVPNAVTVGNMFCGFLAIFYASSGRFQEAVIAISVAIILDGVDGRVARKLNATSDFGLEFDSLSDVISFGVAPAVLAYYWGLKPVADELGVLFCFAFTLCAATRLARFNILDSNVKGFFGLPTPGAAGAVVTVINLHVINVPNTVSASLLGGALLLLSYLMVSPIEYASIKQSRFRDMPVTGRILVGALIALLWYAPRIGLSIVAVSYALSGPVLVLFKAGRNGFKKNPNADIENDALFPNKENPEKGSLLQDTDLH